jgi:hypothetical protein
MFLYREGDEGDEGRHWVTFHQTHGPSWPSSGQNFNILQQYHDL